MPSIEIPDPKRLLEFAKLFLRRAFKANVQNERATVDERSALARAAKPITAELAQDYAVWRRAMLWVACVALGITTIVKLFSLISNIDQLSQAIDSAVITFLLIVLFLTVPAGAVLTYLAASKWTDLRRSRMFARYAWSLLFLLPFVLTIVPWGKLAAPDGIDSAMATRIVGMSVGLILFIHVAPATIALCSGVIRSSLLLKTLIPESPTPGWATVCFAPVYSLILLTLFAVVAQFMPDLLLILGLVSLAAAPLIYVKNHPDIVRAHAASEVSAVIGGIRKQALALTGFGGLMLIIFALQEAETFSLLTILEIFVSIMGTMFTLTVVASDFLIAMIFNSYQQAKLFHGTEQAKLLDKKLAMLESVGLTRVSTKSLTHMMQMPSLGKPPADVPRTQMHRSEDKPPSA